MRKAKKKQSPNLEGRKQLKRERIDKKEEKFSGKCQCNEDSCFFFSKINKIGNL